MPSEVDKVWIGVEQLLPEDGRVVETRTEGYHGTAIECELKRDGRHWRYPDGALTLTCVPPTHWRPARAGSEGV